MTFLNVNVQSIEVEVMEILRGLSFWHTQKVMRKTDVKVLCNSHHLNRKVKSMVVKRCSMIIGSSFNCDVS